MAEDYKLSPTDDLVLTMEIYKSFSYEDKQKFIASQDGEIFFRKIRYSPLFKGLPSTTARLVDILAGTAQGGYYAREGELEGAPAEDISLFDDKRLNQQHVESCIMASVTEPHEGWISRTDLMKKFKSSGESIEAALTDALQDGRIAKIVSGGECYYAMA